MTRLFSISATDASVGAGLTYDAINTVRGQLNLNDVAKKYNGFMFSGSPVAITAAEAASGRIKLTSTGLKLVGEIWTYGASLGAGIATNNQGAYFPPEFFYLDIPATGGETITSEFASYQPDPTAAWSVVISHVHSPTGGAPADYFSAWANGSVPPHQGGDNADTTISAVTRTSLGSVTIEGDFSEVVGIRPMQVQDPVGAAAEEAVGYIEMTSGIGNVDPGHIPLPSITPALGTPVGGPVAYAPTPWMPWYAKRTEKTDRLIEPFVILSTALTAANDFSYSLAYKR